MVKILTLSKSQNLFKSMSRNLFKSKRFQNTGIIRKPNFLTPNTKIIFTKLR